MSKHAAEHHTKAAEHHEHAAKHHRAAAKQHDEGHHEKAAHHAHAATGHHKHAEHHGSEAAKAGGALSIAVVAGCPATRHDSRRERAGLGPRAPGGSFCAEPGASLPMAASA